MAKDDLSDDKHRILLHKQNATIDYEAYARPSDGGPGPTDAELLKVGVKHDQGKDTFDLLPFDSIGAISKVLDFGANKYTARNWEKGMDWTRPWNACIRHLEAWMRREDSDPESGFSHLWHAGCCILFLISFELRGIGKDNRPPAPPLSNSKE